MDEQPAAEQPPAENGSVAEGDEDLRRKFQEALARKHARGDSPHGQAASGRGIGPSSGGHTQRQFRRKSG